jgi:predicted permease
VRALDKTRLRLRSLFGRRKVEAELEAELQFHLDALTEESIAKGEPPAEARRLARRQMGNVVRFEEECRDLRGVNVMENIGRDLRYAARALHRSAGFTAVAVLTLALCIGANTAIFSVVKSVLLAPLAYRQPERIVAIQTLWTKTNHGGNVSGGDYPDLVAEPSPFAVASRYSGGELPVEVGGHAEFVPTFGTDAGFADVFQVRPVAGRLITREEFRSKANVAVVSEGFASEHFGGIDGAVGRVLHIEENAISIVGVLPADFHFPQKAEIWTPIFWENTSRTAGNYRVVALLRPGVTPEAARTRLAAIGARLQQAFPATHKEKSFVATSLRDLLVERSRTTLWMLMASVGLVLLVGCANLANLLLARATTRRREMAVRAALGASRRRIAHQMLAESVVIALAGGAIGLVLAFAGVDALLHLAPPNLPRLDEIRVDTVALLFNLAISLGAAGLFGFWPALRAARVDLQDALKQGGARGVLGGGRGEWIRGALVSFEVALALVLTLGAGLLFRSFLALNSVDPGYRTEGRLVLTASVPAKTKAQHLEAGARFERIFTALREVPGVIAVAGVMGLPNGPYSSDGLYAVEGMHEFISTQFYRLPHAGFRLTSPGYFGAMSVPLIAGRDFNERDVYQSEPVAIVSANLVRQVFGNQSPLGRRVKCGLDDRDVWMRVVGVVGDMRNENPATPPGPELYMAYRQHPYDANDLHIVVRAERNVSAAARRTIARIDPEIPLKIGTLEQFRSNAIALPRFRTALLIVFAMVAGALAFAGVYGVMNYAAAQRQTEMGLRVALGATRGDVISILVGSSARLTGAGLACGLAIAIAAGRLIGSMLYSIRPGDPLAIATAVVLLSAAALGAALIPALRVARVDPALALREE